MNGRRNALHLFDDEFVYDLICSYPRLSAESAYHFFRQSASKTISIFVEMMHS